MRYLLHARCARRCVRHRPQFVYNNNIIRPSCLDCARAAVAHAPYLRSAVGGFANLRRRCLHGPVVFFRSLWAVANAAAAAAAAAGVPIAATPKQRVDCVIINFENLSAALAEAAAAAAASVARTTSHKLNSALGASGRVRSKRYRAVVHRKCCGYVCLREHHKLWAGGSTLHTEAVEAYGETGGVWSCVVFWKISRTHFR